MYKETWVSMVTIWLAIAVIGVGTYAYFTDTESSMGNTMTAGVLNLQVDGADPYAGQLINIMDLKPGVTRYSNTIPVTVNDNPGKIYKRLTVTCDKSLDTVIWFDLSVMGEQIIPTEEMKLSEINNVWIYLGDFPADTIIPVVQSFTLEMCLPEWLGDEQCTFKEEFSVEQINDPTIPENCYNPYGGNCPGDLT